MFSAGLHTTKDVKDICPVHHTLVIVEETEELKTHRIPLFSMAGEIQNINKNVICKNVWFVICTFGFGLLTQTVWSPKHP